MKIRKKHINKIMVVFIILFVIPFIVNGYVVSSTRAFVLKDDGDFIQISGQVKTMKPDCILVLGAGLKPNGTPNHMLADRLDVGIQLYKMGIAKKLLFSGDNGRERYDEVNAMKDYALAQGIPLEDIFLDHAGFSTYESMYRAKAIFNVKKAIVVTQQYHQYRALYMGQRFGIEVLGVVAEPRQYAGQNYRDFREFLARNKDFFKMIVKPKPTYLGETIPISGSSLPSHDK